MDSQNIFTFSLCFLLIFPPTSSVSIQWSNRDESVIKLKTSDSSFGFDPTRVTQLSWTPRFVLLMFAFGYFYTRDFSQMKNAKGRLTKSVVVDDDSGESVESEERTSSGMVLSKRQDDIVANVEDKLAAWTFLPEENGEFIQILHYENGQKYEPHYDYFNNQKSLKLGGHRIATVLMYLSNVVKGGETVFPMSRGQTTQFKDNSWSECAKQGYAVKPMKGNALLFFNLHPNATTDPTTLHGSCPVIEGEKWPATKWIRVSSFDISYKKLYVIKSTECVDENEICEDWAKIGECERNPTYMIGSDTESGYCRKSCKAC